MKFKTSACVVAFLLLVMVNCVAYRSSAQVVTITVKSKERITQGSGKNAKQKYLIWTNEGEVFEDTDTITFGKFDSSDIYGRLEIGKSYKVRVAGWRMPALSSYRNIVEIVTGGQ